MWNIFVDQLKYAVNESVPTTSIKPKPPNEPFWFNRSAKKIVQKYRKTYNKYKRTGNPFYQKKYKEERRAGKRALRAIKESYIKNKICGPLGSGNSKPFYRHLKWIQNTARPPFKLTRSDGVSTGNPLDCADLLNNFFCSQFCPQHQIVDDAKYHSHNDSEIQISPEGVLKLIHDMKNGKSPGPDSIRKEDLLIDPLLISRCLSHIFNVSLTTSKLPQAWKIANVSPLHKKGATDQANNYRPISLTSLPCKLLEHIVIHYLNEYLDSFLHNRQHGFRRGLSCETQLCGTYHDIARYVDKGDTVHAVIMDFAKAFDKVPHQLLMSKLSKVPNINSKILMWIHDFLRDRKQRVVVSQHKSQELKVTSGVPQGSVLGPTLFLVYINDLPQHVNCHLSLFADDTLIYQTVNTPTDHSQFQCNIDAMEEWANTWLMSFNVSKCSIMAFNQKQELPSPSYTLANTPLDVVQETKYLGVIIQSNLKFHTHIQTKIIKAKRQLGMIKRALYDAPKDAKLLAYTSLCRPLIEYASALWDPVLSYLVYDLDMVQNCAVRFISNLKGRESVTKASRELNLETLSDRRMSARHNLLMKILSKDDNHPALIDSYDEIMNTRTVGQATTRATTRGEPTTIYARSSAFHSSFLPRTVRELKGKLS